MSSGPAGRVAALFSGGSCRGVKATDMLVLVLTPEDVVTMRAAGPASCVYRTGADIVRCKDGR